MKNKDPIFIALNAIPKGKVISYGGLAQQAGLINGARQVGSILKNLPQDSTLPWHRVVNSQRKITFTLDSHQYKKQRLLLEKEGITFKNERILKAHFLG